MDESNTGWFFAGVSTVIATLASVVAFLFKLNETKNSQAIAAMQNRLDSQERKMNSQEEKIKESEIKHDKCEEDRQNLAVKVANLTGKLDRYIIDQTDSRKIEIERNRN